MSDPPSMPPPGCGGDALDAGLAHIQAALAGLRFGVVTARLHEGIVVQVDRTERVRLPAASSPNKPPV